MLIKINSKNIKKYNENNKNTKNSKKRRICSLILTGTLATTLLSGCNRTIFDTKYGFDKALIYGDDTAILMDVFKWKDYSGEQLQFITQDGFTLLSSSFDTNCFYGTSDNYSALEIAKNGLNNQEELYLLNEDNGINPLFNKDLLDTNWSFNKSLTFNGNHALILPIKQWRDYEGEQLQVITEDGLVLNLCSYNSKLAYDANSQIKATDFAKYYVGNDGVVTDLSDKVNTTGSFNYDLFDTKWGFNKAIVMKEDKVVILPIDKWCDYEGEQLQLVISNGPTIVTAAYDTILVNDIESTLKASDIANSLVNEGHVVDLTNGYDYSQQIIFNGTIFDLNYGFTNAIFSNDNSATALKISKWCDYEGEQLQVKLSTGDVILSSSMMLDLFNGGTEALNASTISKYYVSDKGKNIDKTNGNYDYASFNKYILDSELKFNYALKVVDGNVTIIPLSKWEDFANVDGNEDKEASPNCEQFQLVLPDGTALVTTAYNTILVNNKQDIMTIAEYFRGPEGVINDLTPYVGAPTATSWNFQIFDTRYHFSQAILENGQTTQILPISQWLDFAEGEQLQINFKDNSGVLTSFVNTTLVDPKTDGIEKIIAQSFSGQLEEDFGLVHKYN